MNTNTFLKNNPVFRKKTTILLLLIGILTVIAVSQENARFAGWMLMGAALSCAAEYTVSKLIGKKGIFSTSALVTGLIVAGVIEYHQPFFVLVIFSCLAIISKYTIRFNNKHIFNPANFALFIATLSGVALTWGIESNKFLVIVAGLYIMFAYRRGAVVISFLAAFLLLFSFYKINPVGVISWFFVFIMLIDPKTSPEGARQGVIFGSLVAAVSFIMFKYVPRCDPYVTGLFVAGLASPLIERLGKR